jgi:hypothetical protein
MGFPRPVYDYVIPSNTRWIFSSAGDDDVAFGPAARLSPKAFLLVLDSTTVQNLVD